MLTQQIITALLIGLSAGVLSGLVGVGGGIITVSYTHLTLPTSDLV